MFPLRRWDATIPFLHTGVCVGIERRCDRRKDCADGSDENDCTMVLRSNNVPKIKTNNGSNEIVPLSTLSFIEVFLPTLKIGILWLI